MQNYNQHQIVSTEIALMFNNKEKKMRGKSRNLNLPVFRVKRELRKGKKIFSAAAGDGAHSFNPKTALRGNSIIYFRLAINSCLINWAINYFIAAFRFWLDIWAGTCWKWIQAFISTLQYLYLTRIGLDCFFSWYPLLFEAQFGIRKISFLSALSSIFDRA